jgi:hypothetical protein
VSVYTRPLITDAQVEERVKEFAELSDQDKELRRLYKLADLCASQAIELGLLQAELRESRQQLGTMTRVIDRLMECEDES